MEKEVPTNPFQEISSKTNQAFADLQEGMIFTEKFDYYVVIAIIRKNLVVVYQGTQSDLKPICYSGPEEVRKKFSMSQSSGYWVNFWETNKSFSEKLINE